jgi:NADH-quinone oxidoreductase subunit J
VTLESVLFYGLAAMSVVSAVLMITRRNPVMSVLFLIMNFFALAGLYLTLQAQFIAVIQIFVYAGAIMVLFLFVIMLLNLGDEKQFTEKISYKKIVGTGLAIGVLLELLYIIGLAPTGLPPGDLERGAAIGTVEVLGTALFTRYLFPFEITSILLLVAIVGAVLLAKKKLDDQ